MWLSLLLFFFYWLELEPRRARCRLTRTGQILPHRRLCSRCSLTELYLTDDSTAAVLLTTRRIREGKHLSAPEISVRHFGCPAAEKMACYGDGDPFGPQQHIQRQLAWHVNLRLVASWMRLSAQQSSFPLLGRIYAGRSPRSSTPQMQPHKEEGPP